MESVNLCVCGCGEPAVYAAGHGSSRYRRTCLGPRDYMVEDCGYETPCWIFKHARKQPPRGRYSYVMIRGVRAVVHRVMYEQEIGPIPDGLVLDHLCGQHGCCRPDHLEPVTLIENTKRYHRSRARRLTPDQVRAVRETPIGYGSGSPMARDLGVSDALVSQIRNGHIYKDF